MIRIKRLKSLRNNSTDSQCSQFLLNIFEAPAQENSTIVNFLHGFLPNSQKKLTEHYAITENNENLAILSLKPQNKKNTRWLINRLCIGKCSDETLLKLVKHIIAKYGDKGVETFITFVNERNPELKQLFQEGCNFRGGAHLNLWQGAYQNLPTANFEPKIFCDYKKKYSPLIAQLHNQMIFTQYRQSLSLSSSDFDNRFKDAIEKKVLYCEKTNSVEGYFLLFKREGNLYLELLLSESYNEHYPELLNYCSQYINKGAHIMVKKFSTSYKRLEEELEQRHFKQKSSYALLIKDYWAEIKKPELSSMAIGAHNPA